LELLGQEGLDGMATGEVVRQRLQVCEERAIRDGSELALIKSFEGFHTSVYLDGAAKDTSACGDPIRPGKTASYVT